MTPIRTPHPGEVKKLRLILEQAISRKATEAVKKKIEKAESKMPAWERRLLDGSPRGVP